MKKILSIFAVASLFSGCASVFVKKPEINSVKRIAIVGMTANHEIYDVKSKKKEEEGLKALGKLVGKAISKENENMDNEERIQIVTFALKTFGESLSGLKGWEIIPPAEVIANSAYQNMNKVKSSNGAMGLMEKGAQKLFEAEYVTPPNMHVIPLNELADPIGTKTMGSRQDEMKENRKPLVEVCAALNADAVVLVQLDLAYEKTMLSGMGGTGLFSGVRGKAKPSVAAAMIMINKDDVVLLKTAGIEQGGGERIVGESTPMLLKGQVDLKDSKGVSVHNFNQAIEKVAAEQKKEIEKALSK